MKHRLTPHTKINSKYTIDLKVRAKTVKLFEQNMGVNLHILGLDNGFLATTPKAQATKEKINKTRLHQNSKLLCCK